MIADPITVWPKENPPTLDVFRGVGPCIVCDLYIEGIERAGTLERWGWRAGDLENIDHHAPVAAFESDVTSTELAIARCNARDVAPPGTPIIINHTDCDSILSSGIVSRRLAPLETYRAAALAADHTGAEDPIADMLQGMDDKDLPLSGPERLELGFEALAALEVGAMLPPLAQQILEKRRADRARAREIVESGRFNVAGKIWWAELPSKGDGELFVPRLPDAEVVVIGFPSDASKERWTIKARLGLAKRPGMSLQAMEIPEFDPNWGGRWDAGTNSRVRAAVESGTAMTVAEWVGRLQASLTRRFEH